MTKYFISIFFLFITITSFCQTVKTVDSLQNEEQTCLDKGRFMLGCSITLYNKMDSLLNVVYFKLYYNLDSSEVAALENEQRIWLVKRDKVFKLNKQKIHKEAVVEGFDGGQDEKMILADENTKFVKSRVIDLIKRLNN